MPSSTGRSPYHGSSFRSRVIRNSLLNMDTSTASYAGGNGNNNSTAHGNTNPHANNSTNQSHVYSPHDGSNMHNSLEVSTSNSNANGMGGSNSQANTTSSSLNFSPNFSSRLSFGSAAGNANSGSGNASANNVGAVGTSTGSRRKSLRSSRSRNSLGSNSGKNLKAKIRNPVNAGDAKKDANGTSTSTAPANVTGVDGKVGGNAKNFSSKQEEPEIDHNDSNINPSSTADPHQKLRSMIHKLLHNPLHHTTPSPASAVFYASILYTQTSSPQDAYLFANALLAHNEKRRATFVLEKAGLLSFETSTSASMAMVEGITTERAYVRLVVESMLLASNCFASFGEWDEVTALLEDVTKYQYHNDGDHRYPFELSLDEMRGSTQALNAFDDDYELEPGIEMGLRRLAQFLQPDARVEDEDEDNESDEIGIHPIARVCLMRGKACDETSNPTRAAAFLKLALQIDVKCIEAWTYLCQRRLMTSHEEMKLVLSLKLNDLESELEWLKDIFYARLALGVVHDGDNHNVISAGGVDHSLANIASPITNSSVSTPMNIISQRQTPQLSMNMNINMDATSIHFQKSPSTPFNFNSTHAAASPTSAASALMKTPRDGDNLNHVRKQIEKSFQNLHSKHHLSQSPEVLALAATRSYYAYNLSLALHYCQILYEMDPLSVEAAGIQIATLTALGHKRPLFRLAHALVDADSKSPTAWYAVGCYYYACGRFDLAQQHYWRATRLGPRDANCWVAFGCAFAACDENDQANACFRTAQRLNSGSHYPMLYMGMEHLRTNNIPLAGHFLRSSRSMEKNDPLCCNELGVWAYRSKEWKDGIRWFVLALRLYVESVVSEKVNLSWSEENVSKQDGNIKVNKPRFEFGQRQGRETVASFSDTDCIEFCQDAFWEPTIFNLGQCYRKARMFEEASLCFEKCLALCPEKAMSFSALGFTRHLAGDIDGAIESYHQALSRKPDDPFASEMLNRAMRESLDMGAMIIPVDGDISLSMHDMGLGTSQSRSNLGGSPFSLGDSDVSMTC